MFGFARGVVAIGGSIPVFLLPLTAAALRSSGMVQTRASDLRMCAMDMEMACERQQTALLGGVAWGCESWLWRWPVGGNRPHYYGAWLALWTHHELNGLTLLHYRIWIKDVLWLGSLGPSLAPKACFGWGCWGRWGLAEHQRRTIWTKGAGIR